MKVAQPSDCSTAFTFGPRHFANAAGNLASNHPRLSRCMYCAQMLSQSSQNSSRSIVPERSLSNTSKKKSKCESGRYGVTHDLFSSTTSSFTRSFSTPSARPPANFCPRSNS